MSTQPYPNPQAIFYQQYESVRRDEVVGILLALRELVGDASNELAISREAKTLSAKGQTNIRNDMYVASEAIRLMENDSKAAFTADENAALTSYKRKIDKSTKFIPDWVKVAVALALGLGTMVGWKRIVVTVGEKIGKEHLTYAQGASAGLVAMLTIFAANQWGMPVSTTYVLSSGVAGTMSANKSGLQLSIARRRLRRRDAGRLQGGRAGRRGWNGSRRRPGRFQEWN